MADWVCGRCRASNREQVVTCASCGAARGAVLVQPNPLSRPAQAAEPAALTPELAGVGLGADGVGAAALPGVALPAPRPALPAAPEHLLGAVLGGAIGAALATGIWYGVVTVTNWQVGLIAIAVGFVVGQGVVFGANGRTSPLLIPISLGFTLVALVVSEYLIAVHFVNVTAAEIGASASEFLALFSPIDLIQMSIESEPITLLFWAIAGYEAFVIPMRAGRDTTPA